MMRVENHINNLFPPYITQTRKKTVWDTVKAVHRGEVVKIALEQERIPTMGDDHRRDYQFISVLAM